MLDTRNFSLMEAVLLIILFTIASSLAKEDNLVRVSGSGDFIVCDQKPGDVILYQGSVEKSHHWLRKVEDELKVNTGGPIIHCIRAADKKGDGNAAVVSVTDGGVGYNHATLNFESLRSSGIHYNVTISGQ